MNWPRVINTAFLTFAIVWVSVAVLMVAFRVFRGPV